jgi:hypothetical protein
VVVEAAEADGHRLFAPNLAMLKDGVVVGATNTGPYVDWWLRTDQPARVSHTAIQVLDSLQAAQGWSRYRILCSQGSPYYPLLERAGFVRAGEMTLFERSLDGGQNVRR